MRSGKEDEKHKVAKQKHRLTVEAIYHPATEGAHEQRCECVAREHDANHLLVGIKGVAQVERQHWQYHIECEKQQEIACENLHEVGIP